MGQGYVAKMHCLSTWVVVWVSFVDVVLVSLSSLSSSSSARPSILLLLLPWSLLLMLLLLLLSWL
jgi:hypothetical protein